MKKNRVLFLTELAVLIAIILIFAFTGIGYLRFGVLSITLITIPVAVGAVVLGPLAGTLLGLAFGLTSFIQCFGADPFGAILLAANPFYTFILCVVVRVLVGLFTGLIAKALKGRQTLSCIVSSLLCPLINTVLFLSALFLLFWNVLPDAGIDVSGGIVAVFVAMAGVNAVAEIAVTGIVGAGVSRALLAANKR